MEDRNSQKLRDACEAEVHRATFYATSSRYSYWACVHAIDRFKGSCELETDTDLGDPGA